MKVPWNVRKLFSPPKTYRSRGLTSEGIEGMFYESVPYRNRSTRVFAWLGLPKRSGNERVPAMLLIHGGGGAAFDHWVRHWTKRGYAALAMDTCGCVPIHEEGRWKRHRHGGPGGWGDFQSVEKPLHDQWPYHAVAAVILGHSLLRSLPEVDETRVGATGISWGGYLTTIAASLDSRLAFAAPVYGCGFLGENSAWLQHFIDMGAEKANRWLRWWDPANYLPNATLPMLWVNGTNDSNYLIPSWQRSSRLTQGPCTRSLKVRFPHDHVSGETVREVFTFADHLCFGASPLPNITGVSRSKEALTVRYRAPEPLRKATFCYTTDVGCWPHRRWRTRRVNVDAKTNTISAPIPTHAKCYFLSMTDSRGNIVSSEYFER